MLLKPSNIPHSLDIEFKLIVPRFVESVWPFNSLTPSSLARSSYHKGS